MTITSNILSPAPSVSERGRLRQQMVTIADRLRILDTLPREPDYSGAPPVIYFRLRFRSAANLYAPAHTSNKAYTYAAVRCPDDGLWYTTGPLSPKGYTWEELAEWMTMTNAVEVIWLATEFTPVEA